MISWKKEAARDVVALGSIPFFILVIARALIGPYWGFVYQLFAASIILLATFLVFKKVNYHISRGIVLVVFTTLFYQDGMFSWFVYLFLALLFASLFYLKKDKLEILYGTVIGIATSGLAYYVATLVPLIS